ncbi:Hypothetical protein POVR1_LOCUS506 [uncultured virus]|nr:Hypothetical protein POVR1_LOCUS506 [uncultured virus]
MDSQSQQDAFVPWFKPFLICDRDPEILTDEDFNRTCWYFPSRWIPSNGQSVEDRQTSNQILDDDDMLQVD